jgi:DNA-binding NarL/FixJ family response regulator
MHVLVIDDHPLILAAMQAVVTGLGNDHHVTCAGSAPEARARLLDHADFDLMLLDLMLGADNGFDLLQEFRTSHPRVPVVVLSASESKEHVLRALDLGAMGYITKRAASGEVVNALRIVLSGGLYVPPQAFANGPGKRVSASDGPAALVTRSVLEQLGLTPRQGEVLKGILRGLPNKMIARELDLSVETVKDHVQSVLRSLHVTSRTQAVLAIAPLLNGEPGSFGWRSGRRR